MPTLIETRLGTLISSRSRSRPQTLGQRFPAADLQRHSGQECVGHREQHRIGTTTTVLSSNALPIARLLLRSDPSRRFRRLPILGGSELWDVSASTPTSFVSGRCAWSLR